MKFAKNLGENTQMLLISLEWFYTQKFNLKLKLLACTLTYVL